MDEGEERVEGEEHRDPHQHECLDRHAAHAGEEEQDYGRREGKQEGVRGDEESTCEGTTLTPTAMARAAPKLAADEMPRVNGSARGLFRMVCICAPAMPSMAPTSTAMIATGRRTFHTTTSSLLP